MLSSEMRAHLALLAVAIIYGANYSIAKEVLDDGYVQPSGFILLRALSGVALFWLFQWLFIPSKKRKQAVVDATILDEKLNGKLNTTPLFFGEIEHKDVGRLVLCSLFGIAINQLCFFHGLKHTSPVNASLIMLTTPILVLLISSFLIKERINAKKIAGIILGIAGAGILVTHGKNFAYNLSSWSGDLFVFINAASYGLYLVLVKSLMNKYHPLIIVKWAFTFGLLFVLPFGITDLLEVNWSTFPSSIWLALGYVLLFTTFFAYLLNAFALKTVNPSVASIYIYLQPLVATAIALYFLKDTLTTEKLLAGACIFMGVFLVSKR